jgi:hypothetical protein
MSIRVGAHIQPQHAEYRQMRDAWVRAEEMGVDTLFNWDHFFPCAGIRTASTSSAGRCSPPWPRLRRGWSSAPW